MAATSLAALATINLATEAEIPWPSTGALGMGVSAPSGELLKSAVTPFEADAGSTLSVSSTAQEITSTADLKKVLGVEAKAQFSTPAVAGEAMARLESSVEHSERVRTILYEITFEWQDAALATPMPSLTESAAALWHQDPGKFRDAYGDYFIAGYTKKAQFLAFARLASKDEKELTRIAATVKASFNNAGNKWSGEAATNIQKVVEDHSCEMSLKYHMTGLSADGTWQSPEVPDSLIGSLPGLVEHFKKNAIGCKTTAKLVHYHRIEPDIPTVIDMDHDVFLAAEELHENLARARVTAQNLPLRYREEMTARLDRIRDRIAAEVPRDLSCSMATIVNLAEGEGGLASWEKDAQEILGYLRLWRAAVKARKSGGVVSGSPPATIEAIRPVAVHEPYRDHPGHIDVDLIFRATGITMRVSPGGQGYHNVPLATHTGITLKDRKVCGYRTSSSRASNKRGTITVTSGGVDGDNIAFHMRSEYDRGLDWTVEVFTVPATKFDFVTPDDD
jgi:hypothetical protein